MAKTNKTKYALLGVLSHTSGSGYDIKKFCDNSIGYFWNENYGHIYPVLKKLEEENLISKHTEENEGRPARNIYSITESGRDELNTWLKVPPEKSPTRSELLLKIFFSKNIPVEDIIKNLHEIKSECEAKLAKLIEIEKILSSDEYLRDNSKKDLVLWKITVKCGIKDNKAEIEWVDESIKLLKSL